MNAYHLLKVQINRSKVIKYFECFC